jgi:hypothetical protein
MMSRPRSGDMQKIYIRMGRIDLAKNPRGWWITLWACPPPPANEHFMVLHDTWRGPIRIIHRIQRLPSTSHRTIP